MVETPARVRGKEAGRLTRVSIIHIVKDNEALPHSGRLLCVLLHAAPDLWVS